MINLIKLRGQQTESETSKTYTLWGNDPSYVPPMTRPESEQEKRDRHSIEENKRLIEARKRGGKRKF